MSGDDKNDALAAALGRVPSGLFVCSCGVGDASRPFVASWVMQASFEPPAISIAIEDGRDALSVLDAHEGLLTLSILPEGGQALMKPFFGGDDSAPFGDLELAQTASDGRYLADALAWLECREASRARIGKHHIVLAEVLDGSMLREGTPLVHVRKNGMRY